jgi:hypothetical protein
MGRRVSDEHGSHGLEDESREAFADMHANRTDGGSVQADRGRKDKIILLRIENIDRADVYRKPFGHQFDDGVERFAGVAGPGDHAADVFQQVYFLTWHFECPSINGNCANRPDGVGTKILGENRNPTEDAG